ncbi:hypothetical protein [Luethyella okanaganae]|uniref:Uncharacterized protein n=1 Tax=Luethyella okanaganae TaxID=69372 RepID=A0ABW1VIX9_9MICO
MTMQKKMKVAAGSAAVLAILIAGGAALAIPAQASTMAPVTSTTEPTDTDNVQNEVEDGTADGEVAESGTASEGERDGETADHGTTESPGDDVDGVVVEDGTRD